MTEPEQRWIPLESNPNAINKYVHRLGVDCAWNFVDVYGLEPELLAMVPRPVAALVLLFPDMKQSFGGIGDVQADFPSDLYYTKQTIGNACGTVAIVHALANNKDLIKFDDSKHFKTFLEMTSSMSPEERAKFLEQDNKMGAAHEDCAQEGDTQECVAWHMPRWWNSAFAEAIRRLSPLHLQPAVEAPSVDEQVQHHFVAFVNFSGSLYELDGNKDGPVVHGKTTPETFLEDAAEVIKKFIACEPDNVNFNVMALVNSSDVD